MLQIQILSSWKLFGLILIVWLNLGTSLVSSKSAQNSLRSSDSIFDVKPSFSSLRKFQLVLLKSQISTPVVFRNSRCSGLSVFPPIFHSFHPLIAPHLPEIPIFQIHAHISQFSSNFPTSLSPSLFTNFLFSSFFSFDLFLAFGKLFPRLFRSPFLASAASKSAFPRFRLLYTAAVFILLAFSPLFPFSQPSISFLFLEILFFQLQVHRFFFSSQFPSSLFTSISFSEFPEIQLRDFTTSSLFILFGLQLPPTFFVPINPQILCSSAPIFHHLLSIVYAFLPTSTWDVLTNSLTRHRGINALTAHVSVATFIPTKSGLTSLITYGDTCPWFRQASDACSIKDQDPTNTSPYFSLHLHKPTSPTIRLYSFFTSIFSFARIKSSHFLSTCTIFNLSLNSSFHTLPLFQSISCHHFQPIPVSMRCRHASAW